MVDVGCAQICSHLVVDSNKLYFCQNHLRDIVNARNREIHAELVLRAANASHLPYTPKSVGCVSEKKAWQVAPIDFNSNHFFRWVQQYV